MRRFAFGLVVFAACGTAVGQQPPPGLPSPRVQSAFPAGVKAGTGVEVTVTGFDVEEPEKLLFAHPGLKGEYLKPPTETPDPKDPKKTVPAPKAAPGGPHKFKVTATADVPPGVYDLRFVGKWGVSNPRAFVVGDLIEVNEKEPNNDVPEAQKVEIGTTINGVISSPTDVDYTAFSGKKGQRVVVHCAASSLGSKASPMIEVYDASGRKLVTNRGYRDADALADVVLPADGDYLVRLFQFTYTAGGPDYGYRLSISAAPWIDAVFPPVVEAGKPSQVTLYGRNLPGGTPSEGYTADGRPLEKLAVTVTPPTDAAAVTQLVSRGHVEPACALQDGFSYSLKGPGGTSNPVTILFAREKLTVKTKPAATPESAETVPTPGEVAGFLRTKGAKDWIAFTAKKGDKFTVDLAAERIGASGDFFFSVRDGKDPKRDLSGEQDDDPDTLHPVGFYTRTSDPGAYQFTAPEDGKYLVAVGCRESSYLSGPMASYRLRIAPARPDFRAVVMPHTRYYQTGSAAWQGGTQAYHVFVQRQEGYTGAVALTAEGLPASVTARPLTVGPGVKWGVLVLDVAAGAAPVTAAFTVKATGTDSGGKQLVRAARPASITWGMAQPDGNTPVIAKLDQALVIAVRPEKALFSIVADVPNTVIKPATGKEEKANGPLVVLRAGDKAAVPVKVEWTAAEKPPVTLAAEPMAQNQQTTPVTVAVGMQPTKDKPDVLVTLDAKTNGVPGAYTVVLRGTAVVAFGKDPVAKAKGGVPAEAFATPIQVLVVPAALGKFTTGPLPNNTLKLGSSTDLPIKVERLHDFAGEYKVQFVPAKDAVGVTAADVTIPAGKDEAKLTLKTAADAKPGALAGTVIVTATYAGKYAVTYENKVSFNLAK